MSSLNQNSYDDSIGGASLWVGFGFSFFASVVFLGITLLSESPKSKVFNYLGLSIVLVMTLAYLIMALGNVELNTGRYDPTFSSPPNGQDSSTWYSFKALVQNGPGGLNWGCTPTNFATGAPCTTTNLVPHSRYLQWLRYAAWTVNTPLILVSRGLLAGCSFAVGFLVSLLSITTVGALFATATSTGFNATWPLYALGLAASIPNYYIVLGVWAERVASAPAATKRAFFFLAYFTAIMGIGYAVNFGTAEGGLRQSTNQEIITYTVLDILQRVVFSFVLLFMPAALEGAGGYIAAATKEASAEVPSAV